MKPISSSSETSCSISAFFFCLGAVLLACAHLFFNPLYGEDTAGAGPMVLGLGLASMKERTELSSGMFSIESRPGFGTTILASWKCT